MNEETKNKLRIAMTGKKHSRETIEKIRASHMGIRCNEQGKNERSPYAPGFNEELKESIRNRDGRICQNCGISEDKLPRRLAVHHIDLSLDNHVTLNLISLCENCHRYFHSLMKTEYNKYVPYLIATVESNIELIKLVNEKGEWLCHI